MDPNYASRILNKLLSNCIICPHKCLVNRAEGVKGFCKAPASPVISSSMPHHGEEPPISGTSGSGTIFFTYCNMRCVYCQNYQISQQHEGRKIKVGKLAELMLELQNRGCHNINFVSPSIWIPQIVSATAIAKKSGLNIPLVFNTGGYDNPRIIKMLEGIIDIYMPDIRYSDNEVAKKYSGINNYVDYNHKALIEMYSQVGGLKLGPNNIAKKGMLIRLLVLPNNIGEIKKTIDFIKNSLSADVYLSIMAQYHPTFKARQYPEINRSITSKEYYQVVKYAEKKGFSSGYIQDYVKDDPFMPDFKDREVFKSYRDES
ncbi:MAG: radical SAM protein [Candidatus Humimicrobiaceae bacterium]